MDEQYYYMKQKRIQKEINYNERIYRTIKRRRYAASKNKTIAANK
ncbi:hypothetical protein C7391_1091 [Methanimicrococcus blatticola]|uniref:Uncharacterized protein n=1 Tax=Methanimicrococcus blatticola TaxID=91560 RepID=A0A484F535_9EURY|nr:hypothetical protein C7391_1091 [Methanimicrococcus blatticola]